MAHTTLLEITCHGSNYIINTTMKLCKMVSPYLNFKGSVVHSGGHTYTIYFFMLIGVQFPSFWKICSFSYLIFGIMLMVSFGVLGSISIL